MGKYRHGILGGFKGKVGNIVGSTWKGLDVMKIRPASVTNPNTVRQQDQRNRFGLMMRFLSPQRRLVQIGFRPYAVKMTSFNAAMSYNLAAAIGGNFPDFGINYNMVMLSMGDLPALTQPVLAFIEPASVKLSWNDNSNAEGAKSTDQLMVSIYDQDSGRAQIFISCAIRSDATVTMVLPAEWAGLSVEVLTFFLAEEGVASAQARSLISDTTYAGNLLLE
jgi:hypothetical protein